jgi:hypothetical protein
LSQFLQATLYGLLQGGLLALIAVGFSLVWGVLNVVNLAHGAFVLIGAYVAWELSGIGVDPFVGMVAAAALLFVGGYAIQRLLINLVVNAPVFITLLLTFGLELLLVNGLILAFSADYRSIPTGYAARSLTLGADVRVPIGRLLAFGVAVAITVALVATVRHTRTGLAIMATGMDRGAADGHPGPAHLRADVRHRRGDGRRGGRDGRHGGHVQPGRRWAVHAVQLRRRGARRARQHVRRAARRAGARARGGVGQPVPSRHAGQRGRVRGARRGADRPAGGADRPGALRGPAGGLVSGWEERAP